MKTGDVPPLRVSVVAEGNSAPADTLGLRVASGAIVLQASVLDASDGLSEAIWPTAAGTRFGAIKRLRIGPAGLEIETEADSGDLRRFRLVEGSVLDPPDGDAAFLDWRQLTWLDADLNPAAHKNPSERLGQLKAKTENRLARKQVGEVSPLTIRDRSDPLGRLDPAVFVRVKRSGETSAGPRARRAVLVDRSRQGRMDAPDARRGGQG